MAMVKLISDQYPGNSSGVCAMHLQAWLPGFTRDKPPAHCITPDLAPRVAVVRSAQRRNLHPRITSVASASPIPYQHFNLRPSSPSAPLHMIGHDDDGEEEEPDPGLSGLLLLLSPNEDGCSRSLGALGQSRERHCSHDPPWWEPSSPQSRCLRSWPHEASSLRHYPCRDDNQNHDFCFSLLFLKRLLRASAAGSSPFHRPSSPYPDPRQLGPRSQILATRTSNYHSTSLRNSMFLILISPPPGPANISQWYRRP